jgi:hypothetical protein
MTVFVLSSFSTSALPADIPETIVRSSLQHKLMCPQLFHANEFVAIIADMAFSNNAHRRVLPQVIEALQRLQEAPDQLAHERDHRYNDPPPP